MNMSYTKHLLPILGMIPLVALSAAAPAAAEINASLAASLENVPTKLSKPTDRTALAKLPGVIPVAESSEPIIEEEPFPSADIRLATQINVELAETLFPPALPDLIAADNLPVVENIAEIVRPSVSSAPLAGLQPVGLKSVGVLAAIPSATEASPTSEDLKVAQTTKPLYGGMPPVYFGVGGNIGIEDSSRSATGEWGFSVISKVSLGPRFAVRPALIVSEDDVSAPIPITYNFKPFSLWDTPSQIFVGGGVDLGDRVGGLVNGGMDVAISDDFTLSAQANWRFTEDTAFGIVLGVAYNLPWYFE